MAVNFVKFERGSSTIYNRKKLNHSLDENTLYFIYDDPNLPENGGELYLGYRLISGVNGASSFNELSDVDVSSPSNGALLWYNDITGKWEPATAEILASSNIGEVLRSNVSVIPPEEGKTKAQLLATITDKAEGDIAIVAGQPYVYDGSDWQPLVDNELRSDVNTLNTTVSNIDTRVQTLETSVGNIDTSIQSLETITGNFDTRIETLETAVGNIGSQISQAIEQANHLVYEVSQSGLPQTANAKDNTIYLVPSTDPAATDNYSEYLYVNGAFERLGTINNVSLAGYATEAYVNNAVANLASESYVQNVIQNLATENYVDTAISNIDFSDYALKSEVGDISALNIVTGNTEFTLAEEVEGLYNRLQWQEISE